MANTMSNSFLFKEGMSRLTGAVSIIATGGAAGSSGKTITSCCSVSAEPPMLLVCMYKHTSFYKKLISNKRFSVNILNSQGQPIASRFSKKFDEHAQDVFDQQFWKLHDGLPICTAALASFICTVDATYLRSTHAIVIGVVENTQLLNNDGSPLLYFSRQYVNVPL